MKKSLKEAKRWYGKAAAMGHKQGVKFHDKLLSAKKDDKKEAEEGEKKEATPTGAGAGVGSRRRSAMMEHVPLATGKRSQPEKATGGPLTSLPSKATLDGTSGIVGTEVVRMCSCVCVCVCV